jgi:hypothetical protein
MLLSTRSSVLLTGGCLDFANCALRSYCMTMSQNKNNCRGIAITHIWVLQNMFAYRK